MRRHTNIQESYLFLIRMFLNQNIPEGGLGRFHVTNEGNYIMHKANYTLQITTTYSTTL